MCQKLKIRPADIRSKFSWPKNSLLFQHTAKEYGKYKFLTVKSILLLGNISFRPHLTDQFGKDVNSLIMHTTVGPIYDPGVYSMPSWIPSFCANCTNFQEMTTRSSSGQTFICSTGIQSPEERHSCIAIQQFYKSSIKIS